MFEEEGKSLFFSHFPNIIELPILIFNKLKNRKVCQILSLTELKSPTNYFFEFLYLVLSTKLAPYLIGLSPSYKAKIHTNY